jgi:hypothetical protein
MNMLGETMISESLRVTNETEKINFNTTALSAGVYLLRVKSNDDVMVRKIQITK